GEEFCALLPETDLQSGIGAGERLRMAIHEVEICDGSGQPVPGISISAGLAERRTGENAEDMLQRADQALYMAKAQGRDRVVTSD
ncbi:MAG: diguanylate cyclase (GGDEF)-like protein, partial [Halieaceae bacterium]